MEEHKKKPIKAYSYIRVSTSMQIEGFSVEAQRNAILRHAYSKDMLVVREYADLGISGKNIQNRSSFKEMLEDVASQKDDVKYVLVYKLSRFGRNAADVLSSLQLMQDYGVNLICVEDGIDSSKDSGKLIISVLSAVAEIERENIRAFTMAGRRQKALEGGWNGGFAPYGYRLENGKLYVEEDEAEAIKKIFDMYVNEDLGVTGVSKRLKVLGIEKKVRQNGKLKTFSAPYITKIIDNPVYKGYIAFGRRKTEKIDGQREQYHVVKEKDPEKIIVEKGEHVAIVSEELWEKAHQKRIAMSGKKEKLEKDHEYILSSLVSCPYCGRHMYGVPSKKKKLDGSGYYISYAYACRHNNKATGYSCPNPRQYNCKDIDDQVAKLVIWQLNRTEVLEEMAKQAYKEFDVKELLNRISDCKRKIDSLEETKKGYERKIKELDPSAITFDTMLDFYAKSMEEVVSDIIALKTVIKEDEEKIRNVKEREAQWNDSLNFMLRLFSNYDNYSDYEKKKLMHKLVKNIEIYPEKKAYGYLKSIEFAFPVFKSDLTEDKDTIYTIQDAYPGLIDENGEFTDYDPDEGYVIPEPELDKNGCIPVYPDEGDYFEEHGCLPAEHVTSDQSKAAMQYWEERKDEHKNNSPPKDNHVETVVLLSQRRPDTHIDIKLDLSELDVTAAETKATYQEIKDYVLEKHGLKVSTLYISQVKAKCGIIERECYNKGDGKSRVPQCPRDKEDAIMDALRHFRMI